MFSPDRAALLLVDVQQAFTDPAFGTRNKPDCEANVGRLLAHWREHGGTVVFVRHDSTEPGSSVRVTAANLQDEFAQVLSTDALIDGS